MSSNQSGGASEINSAENRAKAAGNGAAENVTETVNYASEQVRKLGAQAAEVGETVYRQALDAGRYAGKQVEEQPWTAVIVTGLLGLALGLLLGRGSAPRPPTAREYVEGYLPRPLRRS